VTKRRAQRSTPERMTQAHDRYGERVVPWAMCLASLEEDARVHGRPQGEIHQNVTGD